MVHKAKYDIIHGMKKKKCFLFALLIMCHPTLSFAQVDQQFTQQISSHLQDLKHFWGDLVNEIMPIIKKGNRVCGFLFY